MSDPRILSNSQMWQSDRWNATVTRLSANDSFPGAIWLACQLVLKRHNFDAVYTVGVRATQMYGLACAIFGRGNKPHIATEILLDEPQFSSMKWHIKRRLRRFAVRYCAKVIVFSSGERDLYSRELHLPPHRIEFVLFHTNILKPRFTTFGTYGFAAGRSLRDYKTFFEAVDGLRLTFVVVADRASVSHLRVPPNVELHCDIPRSRYLELLEGARFVVVPLKADHRSTGQVVVLDAESLGKPVIASNVLGIRDYISDGIDGLLAEPANPQALRDRIQFLTHDASVGEGLAARAMERILRDHTFAVFTDHCLNIVASAVQADRSP